jgi:hypothetical protein
MTSDLVLSLDHLRDGLVTLVWRESDAVDTVRTVSFVQCVNVSTTTRPVSLSHVHDQGLGPSKVIVIVRGAFLSARDRIQYCNLLMI